VSIMLASGGNGYENFSSSLCMRPFFHFCEFMEVALFRTLKRDEGEGFCLI